MDQPSVAWRRDEQLLWEARRIFFDRGETPESLIDRSVLRSWERCRGSGLAWDRPAENYLMANRADLQDMQESNHALLVHAHAILELLYEQIRHTGSIIALSDRDGLILQSMGDADFVDRANRVSLMPGAMWDESLRGTNAIGTALAEEQPVEVVGGEHFLNCNGFLTCSASPLTDSQGRIVGVLDVSGDYRAYQSHTLGLVRLTAQIIEKRLFEAEQAGAILIRFHPRPEYLGSQKEGMLSISADGRMLAINDAGLHLLGVRRCDVVQRDFALVFETSLATLIDRVRADPNACMPVTARTGLRLFAALRGQFPLRRNFGRGYVEDTAAQAPRAPSRPVGNDKMISLDELCTADSRVRSAVDKARRIVGHHIPMLIQGESGTGKEMFAKAFHNSSTRREGPFVALNCAAIPETLIESELFGYQGGAFTGARKDGAMGKIQQANGGTLFLDEIGDMPLNMQARLLRVLQERSVTPLGSPKTVAVDISLVCATHRRLKEEVARGNFREDLFYRVNGLCISLPPLRERSDLPQLVERLLRCKAGHERGVMVSPQVLKVFESYRWPGNIRQLDNVLNVALALLDKHDGEIGLRHLPEDLLDEVAEHEQSGQKCQTQATTRDAISAAGLAGETSSLEEVEQQVILRALEAAGGNISAAARRLGISRNTLYRKIGRL